MKEMKKRARLLDALQSGDLLRVDRASAPGDPIEGFIVELTGDFALFHVLDQGSLILLNGYAVLPFKEIAAVRILDDDDSFVRRALQVKGISRRAPHSVNLADYVTLLSSIDAHFPLTTLHVEREMPDTCFIGRVGKLSEKAVTLREIDPAARWNHLRKYRFKAITRIDFGGGYEEALWRVSESERQTTIQSNDNP